MNKYILKKFRDNIPEFLKYLTASFFRNKLITNNIYIEYFNLLQNRDQLSELMIKEYQFVKLKHILIYANDNVPYYSKLFKQVGFYPQGMKSIDEMKVIPFLTKEIIRENFNDLISTKKVSGGHYVATTGGSTGEPLKVLLDYDCVFKENAFVNYYRSKFGYHINDKLATFRGIEFENKFWKFNPMQNELIFSPFKLSQKTLLIYLNKINNYKPQFLNGYLSTIYLFAKLLHDNNQNLSHPIKGIFLISEHINIEQRDFVEYFFQVKTSTFYGHSERCIIAEEYSPNLYDFDPYYGLTELLTTNNNYFEIIGTGFLNKTMPLIRYKTDDLCLKSNNLFTIVGSRKSNIGMYGYNGEFISQASFNFHSEIFNNVVNYQFLQKHEGKVNLLLVVNKRFTINEIPLILNEINKKTKGVIDFEIQVVDKLILSKRGKFKMFISVL
jgi:phenylacetate-CoA ligase